MTPHGPVSRAALAAALVLAATAAGGALAPLRAMTLRVRPVADPAILDSLARRLPGRDFAPLTPERRAVLEARERRWRSFPDHLSAPGVDWSSRASRRVGWTPPADRGPQARSVSRLAAQDTLGPPDTVRVAILRIDFATDRGGASSTGNGHFDLTPPDTTVPPIDRPPHDRSFYLAHLEALRRFYHAESYGRVVIEGDVWPRTQDGAYTVSDMADFGPWQFSQSIYRDAVHMFRTMVMAADSQSTAMGDRIPWDTYDRVVLLHAGSDLQSDLRQDSPEDIPSFTLGVTDTDRVVIRDLPSPGDSLFVDRASVIPETANQDGYYGAINGVLAHECGHLFFNFADLYDTNTGRPIVGYWSLMDSGNLVGAVVGLPDSSQIFATGLLPPSVDPFQRLFIGDALAFQEVQDGDTMTILDGERNPDMRRVTLSSDEFLVLENRYQYPTSAVELDQDSLTRVVLGPKDPDGYEYDALLPGPGILVWHIDTSVIPFETSMRVNPDYGWNTDPHRLGVSVIEADGLEDLGDPGSPYLLGSKFDPYYASNYAILSDTTHPNLIPHIGTRPHRRLEVLDDPAPAMRVSSFHTYARVGWPVAADYPPGGPELLAVDADGDRTLDVCWAGGDTASADSAALFAVRPDGRGLDDSTAAFAHLDRRPLPVMAALPIGEFLGFGEQARGPAYFAATTYADGPDTSTAGGRVWLVDRQGAALPGWPPALPSIVTTPPVIAGQYPNARVYVGCADGRVYGLDLAGTVIATSSPAFAGPVAGRLAVTASPGAGGGGPDLVAAGGADGEIAVFDAAAGLAAASGWPRTPGGPGFHPDFLWLDFSGASASGSPGDPCAAPGPELVVHHADRLWAYCLGGNPIAGWGPGLGDTLVDALGAGDPDGDGFPEVLVQSRHSKLAFVNADGHPSPGWPRAGTPESFVTSSPPLAVDVNGDGRTEVVALNASGIIAALDRDGHTPAGWPLASGSGASGAPLISDLDRDGRLDVVAPDRFGTLFAYELPFTGPAPTAVAWPMLGGDPERTSALAPDRTTTAPGPAAGPLVRGSLKAFPNPARRKPVTFAFRLTEPASVEFRILDASGHEVAAFTRQGLESDNAEVWEPGALPAGLYLAHIRFRGAGSDHVEIVPVGLLR